MSQLQLLIAAAAYAQDKNANNAAWATARGAASGTTSGVYVGAEKSGAPYFVYRTFFSWDTSAIPDDAIIDIATLTMQISGKDTTNDFAIALAGHTAASDTVIADADFDNVTLNSPTEFTTRSANISTIPLNTDFVLTLNAAGLAAINKTGYTKLCTRSSKDVDNSTPTARSYASITVATLTIEYHLPGEGPAIFFDGGLALA